MASSQPLKKNTATTIVFPILDADGDLVTGAATLDSEYSLDGGGFTDCASEATEIGTSGIYSLALATGETNGDVVCIQVKTSTSGAKTTVLVFYTAARTVDELAFPATSGRSLAVEADGMVYSDIREWLGSAPSALQTGRVDSYVGAMAAAVIAAAAFAAGAIDAAAIAADAIGSSEFTQAAADRIWASAARTLTALTGQPRTDLLGEDASFEAGTGDRKRAITAIRVNTAQAGAAGTITLDAAASATDDFYNEAWVMIVSGTGAGQARLITDYVGATKVASVSPNWATTPDATSVFVILPVARIVTSIPTGDINAIADQVWDEAISGHVASGATGRKLNDIPLVKFER